jgi:hypothetical protein
LLDEEDMLHHAQQEKREEGIYLYAITLSLDLADKINLPPNLQGVLVNTIVRGVREIKLD